MIKILEYSTTHFCEHILRLHITEMDSIGGELYGASIPVTGEEGEYSFYLFFPKEALKIFADVLITNNKFKEDDWCDLIKECANQIVGYAKNLLNDIKGDDAYKLGIPEYLGRIDFSSIVLEKSITYGINGHAFRLGYKKS
ncbi:MULTISPECIES: hypothetical protein [unclassified Campylobacter]|uniref:hypothetical protein n=1 Tax=unclassified Campylobacter TaxID=2593542 RepID=UPI00123826D3|nr:MULTISPECIES: hypothetical protein [unclassified Campylobacter]KAA6227120.1 hypothetical protein FMM54_02985 [Campylobacter sp. LR185c]KAA6227483.1 hypothetical protein FMM55_02795 [Campylobacter sp. LR196d]KAA6228509.1 hypothetical protein FMM57_02800 [Campylobacter sp. LR286c]KAA6230900.1 hypothetical protein FMM58_04215 [Campylobacter sp. LR291e]KAA6233534.1 hypothetical protein FMM56_03220 [Campylobacter sp. LR264d]